MGQVVRAVKSMSGKYKVILGLLFVGMLLNVIGIFQFAPNYFSAVSLVFNGMASIILAYNAFKNLKSKKLGFFCAILVCFSLAYAVVLFCIAK